jgi:hypothetical protein
MKRAFGLFAAVILASAALVGCKSAAYRTHCAPTDDRKTFQCEVENTGEAEGKPCMRMTAKHVKTGHSWEADPWCATIAPGKVDTHRVTFPGGVDIGKECSTGPRDNWECTGAGILKD